MKIIGGAFCILFGFSGGLVIAGAVYAFIAIIGVVPRLAQKTHSSKYIKLYEEAIIAGGIFGSLTMILDLYVPIGNILAAFFAVCVGIFYGCLAVSLAEVLNVIPILTRRVRVEEGLVYFVFALAIGKLIGSIIYYVVPGFFKNM